MTRAVTTPRPLSILNRDCARCLVRPVVLSKAQSGGPRPLVGRSQSAAQGQESGAGEGRRAAPASPPPGPLRATARARRGGRPRDKGERGLGEGRRASALRLSDARPPRDVRSPARPRGTSPSTRRPRARPPALRVPPPPPPPSPRTPGPGRARPPRAPPHPRPRPARPPGRHPRARATARRPRSVVNTFLSPPRPPPAPLARFYRGWRQGGRRRSRGNVRPARRARGAIPAATEGAAAATAFSGVSGAGSRRRTGGPKGRAEPWELAPSG